MTEWKWFIVHVRNTGSAEGLRGFVEAGDVQAAFSSADELLGLLAATSEPALGQGIAIARGRAADTGVLTIECPCCA